MLFRIPAVVGAFFAAVASASAADLPARLPDAPALVAAVPPSFYVHVGAAGLFYDVGTHIRQAGVPVPGAAVTIEDAATFAIEGGYFVAPHVAVSVTGGIPPISKVVAAGSLTGLGTIAKTQGGPVAATVHYHFDGLGAFQPYVGAGVAALIVFNDEDRLLRKVVTDNALGAVVQGGVDLMLDERWGVFFDVKKAFLTASTKGFLAGVPVRSRIALDPVVLHTGVTYRF